MTKGAQTFSAKDRVHHSVYGAGTISEINARHITIVFDEAGRKKFMTDIVQLEHSSTPAPVRAAGSRKKKAPAVKTAAAKAPAVKTPAVKTPRGTTS